MEKKRKGERERERESKRFFKNYITRYNKTKYMYTHYSYPISIFIIIVNH